MPNKPRSGSNADRRERAAAARQAQMARERRSRLLWIGGGGTVVVALILVVVLVAATSGGGGGGGGSGAEVMPSGVSGATTVEKPAVKVANDTGIDGVVAYDTNGYPGTTGSAADALPHEHVDGPVTYSVTPPVGGDHNGVWMNCGIYDKPVTTERAVHNLEHGAVWITYRPGLAAADVTQLRDFVLKQKTVSISSQDTKERYLDLSPWANASLPAPIVLSSWGHQLLLDSPTDARMQTFVDTLRVTQKYTPEYGAACNGQPVAVSGRPLAAG